MQVPRHCGLTPEIFMYRPRLVFQQWSNDIDFTLSGAENCPAGQVHGQVLGVRTDQPS